MNKKILLLICLLCFLLCSCSAPVQLRDRTIVKAIGIDYEDDEFIVSIVKYYPKSSISKENGGQKNKVFSSKGKTLFNAVKNCESKNGNLSFYGQNRLFVIGYQALDKIGEICDFIDYNYDISLNANVTASKDSAKKILNTDFFLSESSNIDFNKIEACGKSVDLTVFSMLSQIYNMSGCTIIPLVSQDENQGIKVENGVLFKDCKPVKLLSSDEIMGINLFKGKIENALVPLNIGGSMSSVSILSDSIKTHFETDNGKLKAVVNLKLSGNISEVGIKDRKGLSKEKIETIISAVNKSVTKNVKTALEEVYTKNGCDIFLFSQKAKSVGKEKYNEIIKNKRFVNDVIFEVNTDFKIRHSGVVIKK